MASQLGQRLRALRTRKGLSLRAIGEAVGVTPQSVWDWEKGRSQVPSNDVPSIAGILGVTICELYGVEEKHPVRGQFDKDARVREVRDAAVARLVAGHEQAGEAEQEFVRVIAEAAERFRQRLLAEEGI